MQHVLKLMTEADTVTLRQLTSDDDIPYFEAYNASRPEIEAWDPDSIHKHRTLADTRATREQASTNLRMGIWDSGSFVGSINATPNETGVEIGYWVDSRESGKGYATLATRAIAKYFAAKDAEIQAIVVDGNTASVRVLEKSGFQKIATDAGRLIFTYTAREQTELKPRNHLAAYGDTYTAILLNNEEQKGVAIAELRNLAAALGKTPTFREAKAYADAHGTTSPFAVHHLFGSWNRALISAGLEPNLVRKMSAPKSEVVEYFSTLSARLGRLPTREDFLADETAPFSITSVTKHFGNFRGALIAAGLLPERAAITRDGRQYTREDLVAAFLDRCIETEEVLTYRAAMHAGKEGLMPKISAYLKVFDSWNDVILAAGLKPNLIRYTPAEEELIGELRTYIKNHDGLVPTFRQVQESHASGEVRFSIHIYKKVFGTWNDALIAAGLEPNLVRGKEREQVLKNLIEYLALKGRVPTTREYDEDSKQGIALDSRGTLVRIYGKWSSAVNKAVIIGEPFSNK